MDRCNECGGTGRTLVDDPDDPDTVLGYRPCSTCQKRSRLMAVVDAVKTWRRESKEDQATPSESALMDALDALQEFT